MAISKIISLFCSNNCKFGILEHRASLGWNPLGIPGIATGW